MCRRSDTLRGNRRYEPISDEKGFPRGKTQNEIGVAIEVSAFVPWGACRLCRHAQSSSFDESSAEYLFLKDSNSPFSIDSLIFSVSVL